MRILENMYGMQEDNNKKDDKNLTEDHKQEELSDEALAELAIRKYTNPIMTKAEIDELAKSAATAYIIGKISKSDPGYRIAIDNYIKAYLYAKNKIQNEIQRVELLDIKEQLLKEKTEPKETGRSR